MAKWHFWRGQIRNAGRASAPAVGQIARSKRDLYVAGHDVNIYMSGNDYLKSQIPEVARLLKDRPDVVALIRRAAADAQLPGEEELPPDAGLEDVLAWVTRLNVSWNELPRLLWISELARQATDDPVVRQELAAPAEGWAAEVPGGERQLRDFRDRIESGEFSDGDPCIVVRLDSDSNGGPGYRLTIIVSLNGRDGDGQPGDDAILSLQEVKDELGKRLPPLISQLEQSRLTVEFIVPRELLSTDFDQWVIPEEPDDESEHSYRLGAMHAVVVRDLVRLSPQRDRRMWQRRWELLCDCTAPAPDAVRWVNARDQFNYESLKTALLRDQALGYVCLALVPLADAPVHDMLKAGLQAGMPAMLWLRQPGATNTESRRDRRYLRRAIKSSGLVQLPRVIRDLRAEAVEGGREPRYRGWHLSLLWDNPDRMWEPTLLRVPEPSKNGANR